MYMTSSSARSLQSTSVFQSSTIATRTASSGTSTPARLEIRCAVVMTCGLPPYDRAVLGDSQHVRGPWFVGFPQMPQTSRTFAAIPPETADVLRPVLSGLADETIAAIARRGPRLRARHGGGVRQGRAARRADRLPALPRPRARPRGRRAQRPRGLRGPGPRRVPRRPQPRRPARRLPRRRAAGLAPVRRDGPRGGPGPGGPLRPRRGDLRLHRRDLRGVGRRLRPGAVGGGGRGAAPPAAARARAGRGPAGLRGDDPDRGRCRGLGAARGGSRRSSSPAARARRRTSSTRTRPRWPGGSARTPSARRSAGACACSWATPARRGAGARWRRRSAAPARGSGRRSRGRGRPRACAAPARRWRSGSTGSWSPRSTSRRCCWPPTPRSAAELAAARLAPLEGLAATQRERMESTLRAWLDRPGQVQAVAARARRAPPDRALPDDPPARALRRSRSRIRRRASSSGSRSGSRPCAKY